MILFIGHGAERSGPPICLANFQKWIAAESDVDFATVLARGGPLLDEYSSLARVRVLDQGWTLPRIAQQGLVRAGAPTIGARARRARERWTLRGWRRAPLIYINAVSPDTVRMIPHLPRDAVVLTHVHEMDAALRYTIDPTMRQALFDRTTRFIAVSKAVADNLIGHHGIDPSRIEVHHGFVERVEHCSGEERTEARRALGLPPHAFVVGASGMTEWRKAPDLFVRLAADVRRRTDRPMCFVWVGGATSGPSWSALDHEARHLGVADMVRFVGMQDDPGAWFRLLDVFAVVAREDAFPLAALEAASAAVPIVSFDTGGTVELVAASGGAGIVVPYPDTEHFAEAILTLASNPDRRHAMGEQIAAHVHSHHLVEGGAPPLLDTVRALLDLGATARA